MTKMFEVGRLGTNCYIVWCSETNDAIIIDPGFDTQIEADVIFRFIKDNKLTIHYIIDTHGHPDHTCGNAAVKQRFNAPICVHERDAYMLGETGKETADYFGYNCISPKADILLHDGSIIEFGGCTLKALDSPGHSEGSLILQGDRVLFTGDTLFQGSIGRTDFPGSDDSAMYASLRKLKNLPESLVVYAGHGPPTTLKTEKKTNPFLTSL